MLEIAAHSSLLPGIVVNLTYVTQKVLQVSMIIIFTTDRNILID